MIVPKACLVVAMLSTGLLGACAAQRNDAELGRQQDCRRQADRQFEKQNRYLLSEQDQSASPFSSNGTVGITSQGLGDLFHRDQAVDDCLHTVDTGEPIIRPATH